MTDSVTGSQIEAIGESTSTFESSPMNTRLGRSVIKGTPLLTGTAIACSCVYVGLNDPSVKNLTPTCSFYLLTGFYCPGCGMTRAAHNLLNLNFIKAFQYNALFVLAVPVLLYFYVWWMTWAYSGKELPKLKITKKMTIVLAIIAIVFVVGRNFPGAIPEYFAKDR